MPPTAAVEPILQAEKGTTLPRPGIAGYPSGFSRHIRGIFEDLNLPPVRDEAERFGRHRY